MGSFANSLFKIMLGWLQTAVSAVWSAFTSENGSSVFNWIGKHWILLAGILCAVGLVTDLCVYIFRWKPYKVWKSFFSKITGQNDQLYNGTPELSGHMESKSPDRGQISGYAEQAARIRKDIPDESDFSRWETGDTEETTVKTGLNEEKPETITNAGYIVPADSPYRRPANDLNHTEETDIKASYSTWTERKDPTPIAPRRRKRISVSELFNDPEEELQQFDAPQHVIDSRKAYRNPVYPRGWKKSEENGE